MSNTIPYVPDLRSTATTIAVQHLTAGWHSRSVSARYAAVEAILEAVTPFLVDAFLIEQAVAAAEQRTQPTPPVETWAAGRALAPAQSGRYQYLRDLQRDGLLGLRTLDLENLEDENSEDAQA